MTSRAGRTAIFDSTAWLLALAAFAVYVPGVWWGLPHATSDVGKHGWDVDGVSGLLTLSELHNLFVDASPDWYVAYPPFHYLLLGATYVPVFGYLWLTGGFARPSAEYPYGFTDPVTSLAVLALVGRFVTILMACGVVIAAYATARTVWDRKTGVVAALAVMLTQPMIYYARTSNLDVPMLFWLSLSLSAAARVLVEGVTTRRTAWLGAFIALAVATKDQAYGAWALGLLALVVLCYQQRRQWAWRPWLGTIGAACLVYLVAGGVIVHPQRFVAHVRFLGDFKQTSAIVQQSPDILVPLTVGGTATLVRDNGWALMEAVGPVLLLVGFVGFAVAWRFPFVRLLAASVVGYTVFVLIAVQHVQYRYLMFPAYAVALPGAWLLVRGLERRGAIRVITTGLCLAIGAHLGAKAIDLTYQMMFDARRDAGNWLAKHAPPGTSLTYFGLVDQLPSLPRGIEVSQTPPASAVERLGAQTAPTLVLVIPDFSSSPGMERSRFLPERVHNRLQDGSLGYRQVARFETRPLFGRPLKYLPYVNSPVQIYARTGQRPFDDAHAR